MIDLENEICNEIQSKNSTNYLTKNEKIQLKLRFEGEKATYENMSGNKIK